MKILIINAFFCVLFIALPLAEIQSSVQHEGRIEFFQKHVKTLSSEEMKGREAGSGFDIKAAEYIKEQMKEMSLPPLFEGSYLQEFNFYGEWSLGEDNFLIIGSKEATYGEDVFNLPISANGTLRLTAEYVGFGLETEEHNDYAERGNLAGKIFIMEYFLPAGMDERGKRFDTDVMIQKVKLAEKKGAAGVIFVNTESWRNDPGTSLTNYVERANIPVVFARREIFEYWQQQSHDGMVFLSVDLHREALQTVNVAGYIDNNAATTVVLGAHFDHLGKGGNTSRAMGADEVHPGADDNTSGVAVKLELARTLLTDKSLRNNNYIIIAFSAEEKGLQGSHYFVNDTAYDMGKINYMFNFDMIGRLEDEDLMILSTGTSPIWPEIIDGCAATMDIDIAKRAAGIAGSDHANFYRKEIPVLFFFTGLHSDYHTPGDTYDKIDFEGMLRIYEHAYCMINTLEGKGKIEFDIPAPSRRRR